MVIKKTFLLALVTAFLCLILSPLSATVPPNSAMEQGVIQGRTLYEAGQFKEAIAFLQQAAQTLRNNGDQLGLAMTLSNLSLAYQQLGQWNDAERASAESLDLLHSKSPLGTSKAQVLAQALEVRGRLQWSQGKAQDALTTWQEAASTYVSIDDEAGVIRNRINQAQALQVLGLYRQAQKLLMEVGQSLQNQPDSSIKVVGLRSLGNVLRIMGQLDASKQILEQSLAVARRLQSPQAISETLLSLGHTVRIQQDRQAALIFYQQVATISPTPTIRIQSQLNQLSLLVEDRQFNAIQTLWPQIQSQINPLPPSRTAVYARIALAQNLLKVNNIINPKSIAQLLSTAIQQAKALGDGRATSFALGSLGELYEQTEQRGDAITVTQQALFLAQAIEASDIAYRWQWQLGRLLREQGDLEGAIVFYTEAVKTLQFLRKDLVAINSDVQFSFREEVEPVYRELVDLLLRTKPSQANLIQARQTIELLQLAELDNFFREACLEAKVEIDKVIDQKDATAAVIYPILLPDRIEIILKLPHQPLHHYTTSIAQNQVEKALDELRRNLTEPDTLKEVQALSEQVYSWLLQPFSSDLSQNTIKTLVFVLDGSLRNIPMAALYDGQQYLIEKYAIVLTPGLQLLNPQPLKQQPLAALTAGLTQARHGFSSLNYVAEELEQIQSEMPARMLLNQQFTTQAFQGQINSKPFSVVHLATHGQFSSNAEQTFILAWDKPIKVNDLDSLLRTREQNQTEAIKLLVLSACETATGDKQAALGLAGVAIRAGARSTLASLWNIDDASTALLMSQFYQRLINEQLTPVEALRYAQIALLKQPQYRHPLFWSAYILVGNWL